MAENSTFGYTPCLVKTIISRNEEVKIYLYKGCDLVHGGGWFAHSYSRTLIGFGFHKTNKLTAVRQALINT